MNDGKWTTVKRRLKHLASRGIDNDWRIALNMSLILFSFKCHQINRDQIEINN